MASPNKSRTISKPRKVQSSRKKNHTRGRDSFLEQMRKINRHAAGVANDFICAPSLRHIHATLAETSPYTEFVLTGWQRCVRWLLALVMIPLSYISTQTLFDTFSAVSKDSFFWYSPEFWLFATGAILMLTWFFTGIKKNAFLHLYVLGHELTHALFAMCHLGRIAEFKASADGGYIATDKHNVLISLSPYFFPFWSIMIIGIYGPLCYFIDLPPKSEHLLYLLVGLTWTFHIIWTIWMIPRDQPDLRDNDTFFSLVLIYLANVLLLSLLLCVAVDFMSLRAYGVLWFYHAEQFYIFARDVAIQSLAR